MSAGPYYDQKNRVVISEFELPVKTSVNKLIMRELHEMDSL